MKKTLTIFAAVLIFMLAVPVSALADKEIMADGAEAYVLMEASTETVLMSKAPDKQLNCGYLSKLMSLLLIADDIETGKYLLSTELTASESVSGTKGAVVWLLPGDKLTVEELLKAVIIGNANDAMTVLAEASERSIENFVSRMNSEAFDLGLRNTAFYSPYGYYDEREHTTAADMAVICSRLSKYEFLRPYFKTWRDFIKGGATELVSENVLTRTYDKHIGFKASNLVKVDMLINQEPIDAFSFICHADDAYHRGHASAMKLKTLIPNQLFEVPIQASIGKKVIVRTNVRALRKDVLAKCYGGDVSRKNKLLEKQKKGKERLKQIGKVSIPPDAFLSFLDVNDDEDGK